MKEKYSHPSVVNAEAVNGREGAFPFVVAGVTVKSGSGTFSRLCGW